MMIFSALNFIPIFSSFKHEVEFMIKFFIRELGSSIYDVNTEVGGSKKID